MIVPLKETWFHFSLKPSPAKNRDYDNGLTMENGDRDHDLSIRNRDYNNGLTTKAVITTMIWPWKTVIMTMIWPWKTMIDHDLTV